MITNNLKRKRVIFFDIDHTLFEHNMILKSKEFFTSAYLIKNKLQFLKKHFYLGIITDSSRKKMNSNLLFLEISHLFDFKYPSIYLFDQKVFGFRYLKILTNLKYNKLCFKRPIMIGDHLIKDVIISLVLGYKPILFKRKIKRYHKLCSVMFGFPIISRLSDFDKFL